MLNLAREIEACLTTVQTTLDALTSRGDHEAAFDLAKAQYSASIRTSWPANLGLLSHLLLRVASDEKVHLTQTERHDIEQAAKKLLELCDQ